LSMQMPQMPSAEVADTVTVTVASSLLPGATDTGVLVETGTNSLTFDRADGKLRLQIHRLTPGTSTNVADVTAMVTSEALEVPGVAVDAIETGTNSLSFSTAALHNSGEAGSGPGATRYVAIGSFWIPVCGVLLKDGLPLFPSYWTSTTLECEVLRMRSTGNDFYPDPLFWSKAAPIPPPLGCPTTGVKYFTLDPLHVFRIEEGDTPAFVSPLSLAPGLPPVIPFSLDMAYARGGDNLEARVKVDPDRKDRVTVLKVDIDTDIDNDRDIDDSDEPLEETGIGEVVRVDDTDDSPGGEDDLQYMQVKIEPTLTQGVVWFTYDTAKVKIWKDLAQTQSVNSGSEASPNWNLGAGDTVPDHVYVEGLATTDQGSSINIVLHVKVGGTECTDTILTTVTDQVGHYAYFAGARDYLTEYRGPGVAEYKVFRDEVDASGGTDKDFWLVAVRLEKAALTVHDAYSPSPQHTSITAVMGANPNAAVIVNGTFWDAADFGVADHTDGRVINSYTALPVSEDMQADQAPEVKGWIGQRKDDNFAANAPNVEPTVPTSPYGDADQRAAVGGVAALYPTYGGKSISDIINAISAEHGDWNDRQSNHMGFDTDNKVLFVMTTYNAASDRYSPDIVLHQTIQGLVDSGADTIRGLDGGQSVALAHRDRQGNSLAIETAGNRHTGWFWNYVNNYVVITLNP
jgi:hypothetical protein